VIWSIFDREIIFCFARPSRPWNFTFKIQFLSFQYLMNFKWFSLDLHVKTIAKLRLLKFNAKEFILKLLHKLQSWNFVLITIFAHFQVGAMALLAVFTILGNLFILVTLMRHRLVLRPSHFFISSLAITDMLLGLTVMFPRLISHGVNKWLFGIFLCRVSSAFYYSQSATYANWIKFKMLLVPKLSV